MYCPYCGETIDNQSKFCQICGNQIENSSELSSLGKTHNQIKHKIIEGTRHKDYIEPIYYILSFILFPIGVLIWSFNRDRNPRSARNVLLIAMIGFTLLLLLLLTP